MAEVNCVRCGQVGPQLDKPPLRNELGQRVLEQVCQRCWAEWLRYQTALINHYGLDVREPRGREFLTANMEAYFFRTTDTTDIDTSKQGTIGPSGE